MVQGVSKLFLGPTKKVLQETSIYEQIEYNLLKTNVSDLKKSWLMFHLTISLWLSSLNDVDINIFDKHISLSNQVNSQEKTFLV